MENSLPLVSVIVPNYNYSKYIVECLNSIINQTYNNLEIIIGDDNSTDNSIEIIENWINENNEKAKLILHRSKENIGVSAMCNKLLEMATGKYFQPLDADDIILPEKIISQVNILEESNKYAMVYANAQLIDEYSADMKSNYLERIKFDELNMPSGKIFDDLYRFNFIGNSTVLLRTELVRQIGSFNVNLRLQDYYLWLKLAENFEIFFQNKIVSQYRIHTKSMTNQRLSQAKLSLEVLKTKEPYFEYISDDLMKVFKLNLFNTVPVIYELNLPNKFYWLKRNLDLNNGLKAKVYYYASKIGIPFNVFKTLKRFGI